jgi:hypothetical protein
MLAWRDRELVLTRGIFLRSLAAVYLIAFLSFWVQVDGLIGSRGILPAADLLKAREAELGAGRYWLCPTLCWLDRSDRFLHLLCGGGAAGAVLAVAGIAPGWMFLFLWAAYLSLFSVSSEFLSFQWDVLLLETGFLAVFVAPWRLVWRDWAEPPSVLGVWLVRALAFKLMFMSGAVKLLWDDRTWWDLTALHYHYETQPLPTPLGWYAHQLPDWLQKTSVALMYVVELGVPFLIFFHRPFRAAACVALVGFQLLILLTGNYCFFNLLTIVLCLAVADDGHWRRLLKRKRAPKPWDEPAASPKPPPPPERTVKSRIVLAVAVPLLLLSGLELVEMFVGPAAIPGAVRRVQGWTAPYCMVNGYGLFRVMTTSRPEIVVEGSRNGEEWLAYEFRWKPGDLQRRPPIVAPHQPRLDWQMWFAALGSFNRSPWFQLFLQRLLEGSPPVLALLEKDPFPGAPPRYVRAMLYDYRFTDFETRRRTGAWWRRELIRPYSPVLSLRQRR